MAKLPKMAQFGQIWRDGSKGHGETDFFGINYCSTDKKVLNNPQPGQWYLRAYLK